MAKFCPLYSGSSGNCTYISTATGGILVDAGVSASKIEKGLADISVEPSSLKAIFLTHEHTDHVSGVRVFATRYSLPVYLTQGTLEGIKNRGFFSDKVDYRVIDGEVEIDGVVVTPFDTCHDVEGSCGYVVKNSLCKMAVCTDLGEVTDCVKDAISGCDLVMLESNHDREMLQNGVYTYQLKRRILGGSGHLSNNACAQEVVRLCKCGTTRFVLAHLSKENNTEALAKQESISALMGAGFKEDEDFYLTVASQSDNEPIFM